MTILADARVEATVPTSDLSYAREFYEDKLGLREAGSHARDVDVLYECGAGTRLLVDERPGPRGPSHTLAHFAVDDLAAAVAQLVERGVEIADYDLPELKTVNHMATVGDLKFAWFRDPDANIIGIHS